MTPVDERKPKKDWRSVPVFVDITSEACALLEAACNVRYFEQEQICKDGDPRSKTYGQVIDRWTSTHSVRVKPVARHFGNCGLAEYVIADGYDARDLEYLKRCGMKPEDVQRPPRSGDWHGFLPEEIPEGQHRVIVNLDTLEYIDPVRFGQASTLAGMVTLASKDRDLTILKNAHKEKWRHQLVDVAGGLFVMLCHPQRRGGGDIPANAAEMGGIDGERARATKLFKGVEDVKGRWRGGHILGTSEIRYEDWPTTEEILETGTDISDKILRYLVAISHY